MYLYPPKNHKHTNFLSTLSNLYIEALHNLQEALHAPIDSASSSEYQHQSIYRYFPYQSQVMDETITHKFPCASHKGIRLTTSKSSEENHIDYFVFQTPVNYLYWKQDWIWIIKTIFFTHPFSTRK